METLYQNIIDLLQKYHVPYKEYDHDPILNYEDAEREKKKHNWNGIESKNVFLAGNDSNYYIFITTQGNKVDFKKLKEMLGVKLRLANEQEVRTIALCVPGCVAPFGFSDQIIILLDQAVFQLDNYLFSPGVTTKTIQMNGNDLKTIFDNLQNKIMIVE